MLNVNALENTLKNGLKALWKQRSAAAATSHDDDDPETIINQMAGDMAHLIATAVDTYVRTGDISVGPTNVAVVAPTTGGPCTVTPVQPAKIL